MDEQLFSALTPDWAKGLDCAITVCDADCSIIYMNDRSRELYASHGNLIGRNLIDCHGPRSREIIRRLLDTGGSNCYTIEKRGQRKLIFQSAWTQDGSVAGLVEVSIVMPEAMPHYVRA